MGISDGFDSVKAPSNTNAPKPFFDVAQGPSKDKKAIDAFLADGSTPAPKQEKDPVKVAQGKDPYYNPTNDGKPTRAKPFLDGSEVDPRPPAQQNPQDGKPQVQHPTYDEKWEPPKNPAKFSDKQPYSGGSGGSINVAELELQLRMKGDSLLKMRDRQRGTDAASALIAGTIAAPLTEPLMKSLATKAGNAAAADMPWITPKGAFQNGKKAFVSTFVSGSLLTADEALRDRIYGDKFNTWGSQSLTVPLALTMGKNKYWKGGLAVGALASGHGVDNLIPAPDWVPDCFKHFTWADGLALGLAATSEKKGWEKVGLMSVAWLAGNGLEALTTPVSPGKVEQAALKDVEHDAATRSYDSLNKAVSQFRAVGDRNEIIVEHNLGSLFVDSQKNYNKMQREEKLASHRNMVIVAKALGEHHVDKGNRLAVTDTSTPSYVLAGLNLDLGADGLTYLQMASRSVGGAKSLTEMMMNGMVKDKRVTADEIKDLDRVGADIDRTIASVLGKHDIQAAVDGLVKFIDRGSTSSGPSTFNKEAAFYHTFNTEIGKKLSRSLQSMENPDGTPNADAVTLSAKLLRDQALSQIAMATYKMDNGSDVTGAAAEIFGTPQGRKEPLRGTTIDKGWDGAIEALQLAERLAPDNPDLPELKAQAERLKQRIEAARQPSN